MGLESWERRVPLDLRCSSSVHIYIDQINRADHHPRITVVVADDDDDGCCDDVAVVVVAVDDDGYCR